MHLFIIFKSQINFSIFSNQCYALPSVERKNKLLIFFVVVAFWCFLIFIIFLFFSFLFLNFPDFGHFVRNKLIHADAQHPEPGRIAAINESINIFDINLEFKILEVKSCCFSLESFFDTIYSDCFTVSKYGQANSVVVERLRNRIIIFSTIYGLRLQVPYRVEIVLKRLVNCAILFSNN